MECTRLVAAAVAIAAALGTAVAGSGRTPFGARARAPRSPDDGPVTLVRASGPGRAYAGRASNRAW
jgi:hypothetical protein